ncbi:MAG: YihY/virulence factor BrkB family protein [Desulfovibrionales bacterium]
MHKEETAAAQEVDRGRTARNPGQISLAGWKDILLRTKKGIAEDNLSIVAAGVAFFALLAVFPALAALVSIYGMFLDPATVQNQITALSGILPEQGLGLIEGQLEQLVASKGGTLSLGAVLGLLVALWSASKGMKALIKAMNIAYQEKERRSFLRFNFVAVLFTFEAILFVIFSLTLVVVFPVVLNFVGLSILVEKLTSILRWPLLAAFVVVALGLLYRYAPNRKTARIPWLSWGAVVATLLWIAISVLFSQYVSHFGDFNTTYGSIGAVVVLLMWLYLSAFVVVLGAKLNAEMELQTRKDTTTSPEQSFGERGAFVADTLGEVQGSAGTDREEDPAQ